MSSNSSIYYMYGSFYEQNQNSSSEQDETSDDVMTNQMQIQVQKLFKCRQSLSVEQQVVQKPESVRRPLHLSRTCAKLEVLYSENKPWRLRSCWLDTDRVSLGQQE